MTEKATQTKDVYEELHRSSDFQELRRKFRGFVIPWTLAFFTWYMLYVVCSMWAPDFMSQQIVGNINVALVFGLLQFVSTFSIAWLYSRHANKEFDPLAAQLEARYDEEVAR